MTGIFQKQTVKQASILIAVITVSSQLLGIVREAILASFFGTSAELDIILVALAIPIMVAAIFFMAIPAAGIPYLQKGTGNSGRGPGIFSLSFVKINSLLIFAVSIAVFIVLPFFRDVLASNMEPEYADRVILYGRIFCLIIPIRIYESVFRSLLHIRSHFLFPALTVLGFNITTIAILIALFPSLGSTSYILAWLIGVSIQTLLVVIPCYLIYNKNGRVESSGLFDSAGYLRFLGIIILIESIGLMIDPFDKFICGAYLDAGFVSAVHFANIIYLAPVRIFVHSMTTALFPAMAKCASEKDMSALARYYHKSLALAVMLIIPMSAFLLLFINEIIGLLFERGAFNEGSRQMTAEILQYLLVGMLFNAVFFMQSRVFYSLKSWKFFIATRPLAFLVKVIICFLFIASNWALAIGGGTIAMFIVSFVILEIYLVLKKGLTYSRTDLRILGKAVVAASGAILVFVLAGLALNSIFTLNEHITMFISGAAGFCVLAMIDQLIKISGLNIRSLLKK